jgi:hypothetical protein
MTLYQKLMLCNATLALIASFMCFSALLTFGGGYLWLAGLFIMPVISAYSIVNVINPNRSR